MVRNNPEPDAAIIIAPAAVTQTNLSPMERKVDQALIRKPETVWIDLSGVELVESAGLEWLLVSQSRLAVQGIGLVLRDPSPIMVDILLATRLDNRFRVVTAEGANNA